jgi:brefeldin A-inhibited guanine nucleotide-exchange protein
VRLAFDTVEKIVREHFRHLTETEASTFTDCVNCLIAFTNNPHSLDVALNSIAFLRFCALKLAEGSVVDVDSSARQSSSTGGPPPAASAAFEPGSSTNGDMADPASPSSSGLTSPARFSRVSIVDIDKRNPSAPLASSSSSFIEPSKMREKSSLKTSATTSLTSPRFFDRDEHLYYWFPLLAGLSELTFDPRPEVSTPYTLIP